jgi:hypothetical protein
MENRNILFFLIVIFSLPVITIHGDSFFVKAQSSLNEVESWEIYDSDSLDLSIEYPSNTPIQEEAASRFDADTSLEFGSKYGDADFYMIPKVETREPLDFPLSTLVDFILKNNVLIQKPDPNTYIKLVEGVTPLSLPNQDDGVSFLISFIDTLSNKAKLVGNSSFVTHEGVTYRFTFVTPPEKYDGTTQIFNHMLKSIKWPNDLRDNRSTSSTTSEEDITLKLNSAEFLITDSGRHQAKILVDYETKDPSLVGRTINGILEITDNGGNEIKTTSYPDGFTITESGIIQFASSIDDEDIETVNLKVHLTNLDKTESLSNAINTAVSLGDSQDEDNEDGDNN